MYRVIWKTVLAFVLPVSICAAQSASHVIGEQVWIPLQIPSIFGGVRQIKLEATLYKPPGNGPFPIAIINHGSTGPRVVAARETLRQDEYAQILAEHGFASIAPMRRGRGASDGHYDEPYSCEPSAADRGIDNAVMDIDAVVEYLKSVPFVDASKILLTGYSRGGLLSVVYAARRPDRIVGAVNFVGGWMGPQCTTGINEAAFKRAGALSKVPTLWLYAENDSLYVNGTPAQYHAIYKDAGGNATFRLYPLNFWKDGHLLAAFPRVWRADFNEYMKGIGYPVKRPE